MPASTFGALVVNGDMNTPGNPTYSGFGATNTGGTFWNGIIPSDGAPSAPLTASDGTTITPITLTVFGMTYVDFGPPVTPAEDLMREITYNSVGNTVSFTFNGVPVGTDYDLYLYSQNGPYKSATTQFTIGSTTRTATNGGVGTTTFVQNDNYVVFSGLSGPTITGSFVNFTGSGSSFNGFQLVELPEPASLSLLGLGGVLLLRRKR